MSLLKFIERNWGLPSLSRRSLDRLPNPIIGQNPYVPQNRPAIGDMFGFFDFRAAQASSALPPRVAGRSVRSSSRVARVSNFQR